MQGEFEKQVQDKMEELKMMPQPPVWDRIEMELKKDKRRRRPLILLFPILLAAGLAMLWWPDSSPVKQQNHISKKDPAIIDQVQDAGSPVTAVVPGASRAINRDGQEPAAKIYVAPASLKAASSAGVLKGETISGKPGPSAADGWSQEKMTAAEKILPQDSVAQDIVEATAPAIPGTDEGKVPERTEMETKVRDRKKQIWITGFRAGIGRTGFDGDIFFRGNDISGIVLNSGTSGSAVPPPERSYEDPAGGFFAGLVISRQLNSRLRISSGLDYSRFSTTMQVGQRIHQDTSFQNSFSASSTVESYHLPGNSSRQSNHYHFAGIPLSLEYRVSRRIPVSVEAGISLHRLVAANALYYDPVAKLYYRNDDYFRRTQLYSQFGINYTFFEKQRFNIQLAPVVMLSLSDLNRDRANGSQRLNYFGISAKILSSPQQVQRK